MFEKILVEKMENINHHHVKKHFVSEIVLQTNLNEKQQNVTSFSLQLATSRPECFKISFRWTSSSERTSPPLNGTKIFEIISQETVSQERLKD